MTDSANSSPEKLHKSLGSFAVFAIVVGTTLSSGFFLLPGIAFAKAGPSVVLAYFLASLAILPAMFAVVELCTAMPRAGGAYYFLDRSMGPVVGTIGGFGTWLALVLKTSFALVGMGAYLSLYTHAVSEKLLALGLAVGFGLLNLRGTKGATQIQLVLSLGLLVILIWFTGGLNDIEPRNFDHFFSHGWNGVLLAAGMVCVSFGSLTKIASIAEEVKNPERNLPRGVLWGILVSIILYVLGTLVMVGVIPGDDLAKSYTPVADAAFILRGPGGKLLMTVAALLAFASVANAGIMSAARYPLAMSRDSLLPRLMGRISGQGVPVPGVGITTFTIMLVILLFDVAKIAKLASSFILLVFSLLCLSVIIMRESRIQSYDPGFKSPLYPWMPLAGIVIPVILITEMGILAQLFTEAIILCGGVWFYLYARTRVTRDGAIYHIFERLGHKRYEALDTELRGILKEKGLRADDPFDDIIARAQVLDLPSSIPFEEVARLASGLLAGRMRESPDHLFEGFMRGTRMGGTPVAKGAALPHLRVPDLEHPEMVLVRMREGMALDLVDDFGENIGDAGDIQAIFFLISPESDPGRHLRILAQLAGKMDDPDFMTDWLDAANDQELKECLLRAEHYLSFEVREEGPTAGFTDKQLKEITWPEGCLVALIRRGNFTFVPRGNSNLIAGDRLTVIGEPDALASFAKAYDLKKSTVSESASGVE